MSAPIFISQSPPFGSIVFWFGCIGNITAVIITFALFCQLSVSYVKRFIKSPSDKDPKPYPTPTKSKIPYILVMIYLTTTFIQSVIFSSLATNIITSRNLNFSHIRCLSGFMGTVICLGINMLLLSIIFLHRVYVIFNNSAFEYATCTYRVLFALILTIPTICITITCISIVSISASFIVYYDEDSKLAWCTGNENILRRIASMSVALWQTVSNLVLLSLFVKGLWRLNKQLMAHFMKEHDANSIELPPLNPSHKAVTSSSAVLDENDLGTPRSRPNKVSAGNVLSSWGRQSTVDRKQLKPEVERIMTLHNLIKKQAILVFVATVTTLTFWIAAGINQLFLLQFGWDIIVNAICVWMMLDTSKVYWNLCKKYGICICCYLKENRVGM